MNCWYVIFLIVSIEVGKLESYVKKFFIGEVVEDCVERFIELGLMFISLLEVEDEYE